MMTYAALVLASGLFNGTYTCRFGASGSTTRPFAWQVITQDLVVQDGCAHLELHLGDLVATVVSLVQSPTDALLDLQLEDAAIGVRSTSGGITGDQYVATNLYNDQSKVDLFSGQLDCQLKL